jgi:hypothetical protein
VADGRGLVLRGRTEQFVPVPRGGAGQSGGIDRRGIREPTLARRFADVGHELLEPGRGGDLQSPQRLPGADDESVRQPHGQQHEVPGPGVEGLAVAAELRGAGQQVKDLVLVQVPVQGGAEPAGWTNSATARRPRVSAPVALKVTRLPRNQNASPSVSRRR